MLLANLSTAYAQRGYTSQYADQTLTWLNDLESLQRTLLRCKKQSQNVSSWGLILEFSIPRKERRIDVVLLVRDTIVVVEAKTADVSSAAKQQLETYALLLHYFHKGSANRRIIPVLVSSKYAAPDLAALSQREFFQQMPSYWIAPVLSSSWEMLPDLLMEVNAQCEVQLSVQQWEQSPYFPVPSIIDAATALSTGLSIREIAHSEASEHEIEEVGKTIQVYMNTARTQGQHAICFLTGVPGSGKTLVGLGLAHSSENKESPIHFMSGNGPLVKVLQHLFTQESMRQGTRSHEAKEHARTLIENVHVFARTYTDDDKGAPSNYAIIFDEAQRAWNRAQNWKKFKRNYSEPEMLLRIMGRHEAWSFVVALVGGGQSLEEWGRALLDSDKEWTIYASPEVLPKRGRMHFAFCLFLSKSNRRGQARTDSSNSGETLMYYIHLLHLGRVPYSEGLAIQQRVIAARKQNLIGDTLLLLEHPPVVTLGRNSHRTNIIVSDEFLTARGIELHEINRGGDVTYHGPGQLIGYPIIDLRGDLPGKKGPHLGPVDYVRMLEEVLIRVANDFGVMAQRIPKRTGVWTIAGGSILEKKIAAIGVHVSQGVTSHGFALNVTTDLRDFEWIVPCGITDREVTSLDLEAPEDSQPTMEAAINSTARNFGKVFQRQMLWGNTMDELLAVAADNR